MEGVQVMKELNMITDFSSTIFYLASFLLIFFVYLKDKGSFIKGLLVILAFLVLLEIGELLYLDNTLVSFLKLLTSLTIAVFITYQSFKEGVL